MEHEKISRSKRRALWAAIVLVMFGIALGVSGSIVAEKYLIEDYLRTTPNPGLEIGLSIVKRQYGLTEAEISELRNGALTLLEELRIETIVRDDMLDRRIIAFIRGFRAELTPERSGRMERDLLDYLYGKRNKLFRRLYSTLHVDAEQLVALNSLFARTYPGVRQSTGDITEVPRLLVLQSEADIRVLLRPDQAVAFDSFMADIRAPQR